MIFFFNSGFLVAIGIAILILIAVLLSIGSEFLTWMLGHAVLIGIILLIIQIVRMAATIYVLIQRTGKKAFSIIIGTLRMLAPVVVLREWYLYEIASIQEKGKVDVLDVVISLGVYLFAGIAWTKIVMRDSAGTTGTIVATILFLLFSVFFVYLCHIA